MGKYNMSFKEEIPKYIQISRHIKSLIDMGKIKNEEKLPTIRSLSKVLNVNNDTIVSAYRKLKAEGYAYIKMGSGTYAKTKDAYVKLKKDYSDLFKKMDKKKSDMYVDFAEENPCGEYFPIENFKSVINEVLTRDGLNALVYQETLGYEGLRNSISKYLWKEAIDEDNIIIVSGAQQGIDIISKALVNINDNVAVEKPTYSGALAVFKWRRANIFEINLNDDGIDLDEFEKVLKKNYIKCFYTMTYFQNPTGISYSTEKKKEILKLADKYDFYIIEDDYLSEIQYEDNFGYVSFKSLDTKDRVIYIKSFSKIFLPGIRIGYLIMPDLLVEQIENSKMTTDISTSSLMQRALDLYIKNGYWRSYINKINSSYKARYYYMHNTLKGILGDKVSVNDPHGGFSFYLKINDKVNLNCTDLFYSCRKEKVLITPGVFFYKNNDDGLRYFKVGFSKTDESKILKGINIINNIL